MRYKSIRIAFFLVTLIYLLLAFYSQKSNWIFVLKPGIVGTLIILVMASGVKSRSNQLLLISALSFSLIGDVVLMIPGDQPSFFIAGLISFLLAHFCYILLFSRGIKIKLLNLPLVLVSMILLIAYAIIILGYLRPTLGDLLVPVLCYILVILLMAFIAINRYGQASSRNHLFVLAGALLFVISDSFLAINKFFASVPHSALWIMSTYSFAQYFIVTGILSEAKPKSGRGELTQ